MTGVGGLARYEAWKGEGGDDLEGEVRGLMLPH